MSQNETPGLALDAAMAAMERHRFEAVEFVAIDPLGIERGKWGPASSLEKAFRSGVALPLSLHGLDRWGREVPATGLHIESGDRDGTWWPVGPPRYAPWRARPTAVVPIAAWMPDGRPFDGDPRHRKTTVDQRLRAKGWRAVTAHELEFHLLRDGEPVGAGSVPGVEAQAMYDHVALGELSALWDDVRRAADEWAVPLDTVVNEAGPGQFEINLLHGPDAAEHAVGLRHIVRGAAEARGYRATFMAKPFGHQPGNGYHVHASLVDDNGNVFSADRAMLDAAIAGLLRHMPDSLLGLIASWNGFRRLQPGSYAPTRAVWGEDNRSVAVRVPRSSADARRFEHRIAGADANPFIVEALILTAMLDGIEAGDPPPPPVPMGGNAYDGEGAELTADPWAALAAHEASVFVRRALGGTLAANLAHLLRAEFEALAAIVPEHERQTYL